MDAIDLAALDDPRPIELNPAVWSGNLAALRTEQRALADQVEHTSLPSHWRPVAALDGSPTYRVEPPGQPPQWLAGTAAPRTRAAALLRLDQIGDKNPALPTIGAGAELKLLLEQLGPQQAVFVFEEDTPCLAAMLRLLDLSPALRTGRCVVVAPDREQAFLQELLKKHPGLLPPGSLITLPHVSAERIGRLRVVCESVARGANEARHQRLQALTARLPSQPAAEPRFAVLALGPSPRSHSLSRELTTAAERLGWATCRCAATGPRNVHMLPHCERLADFAARLTICVDHAPAVLPLSPGRIVCQWHLRTQDVSPSLSDDKTIHLAASPLVAEALRAAGGAEARVLELYWACPSQDIPSAPAPPAPRTAVILADLPDASATACRIEQPTHKRLWAQLYETAAKAWTAARITQPAALLRAAERASGVQLSERLLREQMMRIIAHVLIPAVVLDRILQVLRQESFEVFTVGTGWHRCSHGPTQPLAESCEELPGHAARVSPLAAILAGPLDPLCPGLFYAGALGWPLLIHSPADKSLTRQLGGTLQPQQHYLPFADGQGLRRALEAIRAAPHAAQERTARVQAHLRRRHTYAERLAHLARELGLEWPGAVARTVTTRA
jgi:hypothetical protein